MRVMDCENSHCPHCVRRAWSHEYEPAHAYKHCTYYDKRVAEVRNCYEYARLNGQISIFDEANENGKT